MSRFIQILFINCVFWLAFDLQAQLTINITSIPASTPKNSTIYIAGNFNNWNPGNPAYQMTDNNNGTYSITFSPSPGTLEYKFTRGSWESVEGSSSGGFIPNRTYNYNGGVASTNVSIAGWEDVGKHTATTNVHILDDNYYMPQLDRYRRIWIYLPPDYDSSSKYYPVIYMHDGQNLFDAFYSFAGEWKVDESMNTLFNEGDYGAIVVGIDNGQGNRIDEYSPWVNSSYGGGHGEAYVSFIVNTLKPHIDSLYRTLPTRDYTAIAGSSMGGLISMYAAVEYPNVFGKAGVFSPALWFSDSLSMQVAQTHFKNDIRTYFIADDNESEEMVPSMYAMQALLMEQGIDSTNLKVVVETDGAHSEWFWAREYPDAYQWLFANIILVSHTATRLYYTVYPNPVDNFLYVSPDTEGELQYSIYSMTGQEILSAPLGINKINLMPLQPGLYILDLQDKAGHSVYLTRFLKH